MVTIDREMPPANRAPLPARFGSFAVIDVLGEGGMGVVYRARHQETNAMVAIKTVSVARRERLMGIRSEIVGLSHFRHPGIVRILAHGIEDGVPWYAMELLEGQTLHDYLHLLWPGQTAPLGTTSTGATWTSAATATAAARTTVASLPQTLLSTTEILDAAPRPTAGGGALDEILRIFRALCEPLTYLHGRGNVHRDLKPSNVFLRGDRSPVLMDFGLVSRARGSVGREALEFGGLLVGTVLYVSPEQIRRESIDARTDLYALGCMLYQAVTGLPPFRGSDNRQILNQHLYEPPLPPSALAGGIDPRLEQLILGLLAKKRRDRIGHADDVARTLTEIGGSTTTVAAAGSAAPDAVQTYLFRPEVVGRDDVLAQFASVLNGLSNRQGSLVLLGGESGIGKTFLAAEVSKVALLRGMRVIGAECAPPGPQVGTATLFEGRGLPMAPLRPLYQAVADHCREGGPARIEKLLGARAKIIAPLVPGIAELPGVDRLPDPPELPGEEAHRRVVESLLEVLAAFAREGSPLLIVLDDLQWADELSFRVLSAMTPQWLSTQGVAIVATFRKEEAEDEIRALAARAGTRNLEIGRMDIDTVGQIAADMLAIPRLPHVYVSFVAQHTEGVPFFVAEYLRMAVAEGLLSREGGRWTFKGEELSEANLNALPLPRSIHDLMVRRLSALGDDLRALVEAASVIGRELDFELLTATAALSEETATDRARELVQRQIFEARDIGRYRFVHDKLREAAYSALAPARREALHRDVARLLEAQQDRGETIPFGELAHHFTQGGLWDKAIDYLERAGEQAFASFAHNEAIAFFTTATTVAPKASVGIQAIRLARWERYLVDSYLNLGQMMKAHEHGQLALRHCGYRLPSSPLGWFTGFLRQAALRVVQRLVPALFRVRSSERRGFINEAAYVLNRLCEPFFLSKRMIEGVYCGFRDLNLAERVPPSEALARGYATMAMVVGVGPLVKLGRAWSDRAIAIARSLEIESAQLYCLARSGCVLMISGDWNLGIARCQEAIDGSRKSSDLRQLGEALTTLALLQGYRGEHEQALALAREIVEVGTSRGDPQIQHWGRNLMVHALARLGRAREVYTVVREMAEHHKAQQLGEAELIFDYGGFALAHLRLGELAEARERASFVRAAVRRERVLPYFLKGGLEGTCEVFLALLERAGPSSSAHAELAAGSREMVARMSKFASLYVSARPRALNLQGNLLWLSRQEEKAMAVWTKALALSEALEMRYEAARARLEIGRRLAPGRTVAGADRVVHLQEAGAVFRLLGATHESARVEAQLGGAGAGAGGSGGGGGGVASDGGARDGAHP